VAIKKKVIYETRTPGFRLWAGWEILGGEGMSTEIADASRVLEWMRDPNRKPAQLAFTHGPERQAAYWIEIAQAETVSRGDVIDQWQNDRIAELLHYPQCWDTAAYPTLADAMIEVAGAAGCSECKAQAEQVSNEAVAWRRIPDLKAMFFRRFMTQRQYDAQRPNVKACYEPFKCANCVDSPTQAKS
jgi:hypothetical protein